MGFFDSLVENSFKQGPNGEIVFYPNGAIGKGVLVPDEETRIKLHEFHKWTYKVAFFGAIPYSIAMGLGVLTFPTGFLPPLILIIYVLYKQHTMIRGLERHELRLGVGEALGRGAKILPNWYYWSFGILSVLMIAMGPAMPFMLKKPLMEMIFVVLGISAFGLLGLALAIKMYGLKHSKDIK